MAIDFQQVRQQIIEMGKDAPLRAQHMREIREKALQALSDWADKLDELQHKVDAALQANPNLRCALPRGENLLTRAASPEVPAAATLLAADGSQINPNRHASVDFCLVNVGAIQIQHGEPDAPTTDVQSKLYYDDQMYVGGGYINERMVALLRDLRERTLLAELAEDLPSPVMTLTDGPLELWVGSEVSLETGEYEKRFKEYLAALRRLHRIGASTAGYIDKPRGDLLVRLLEIALLPQDEIEKAGRKHRPFLQLADADLFATILRPGERSAVLGIQSRNAELYTSELALHFFYLNVSRNPRKPYTVRVEIPAWVVANAAMLDQLHAILLHQSHILGGRPYPYILHRSHEVAVVSRDEAQQVENMIALELQKHGIEFGEGSYKQAAKDI